MPFHPDAAKWFESLELQAMISKLNDNETNYKNLSYNRTQKGKIDTILIYICKLAKDFWVDHEGEPMSVAELNRKFAEMWRSKDFMHKEWVPSALLKLRDMKMIKLALANKVFEPGENWIENITPPQNPVTGA